MVTWRYPLLTMPNYTVTDYGQHETSFQHYTNFGTHLHVQEGTILSQSHSRTSERYNPLGMFFCNGSLSLLLYLKISDKLREYCSPRATFDSGERFEPPRCAEATRIGIIQQMERWINEERPSNVAPSSIFWLYGGAGVGKSALAQTIAEALHQKQKLAASFFFFRNDTLRNDGDTLIPTLVAQLVSAFKGLDRFVEQRIRSNPDLFTKQYRTQVQELLVEPLLSLKSRKALSFLPRPSMKPVVGLISKDALGSRPRLIVIDGLDECRRPEVQCALLRALAAAIPLIPYPLRILVTSRPEPHIVNLFDHDRTLQLITVDRYNLSDDPDADMDIRKFLDDEFDRIRRSHPLSRYLSPEWPDKKSITTLVEQSSRHFIYAATVIRYIGSDQHRPDDRLEVIFRRLPPRIQDRPYAQLDALYSLIFEGVEDDDNLEKIFLALGIPYVHSHAGTSMSDQLQYSKCSTLERILGMKAGDLILILSPISSLVAIINGEVRTLHKSLFDYLLDPTRCGNLRVAFDPARVNEVAATYILKERILANCWYVFPHESTFQIHILLFKFQATMPNSELLPTIVNLDISTTP